MSCDHRNPTRLDFDGGYAVQTASGAWTGYFADRPGEVFALTACPACLAPLHTRRVGDRPDHDLPAIVHSSRRRPSPNPET